MNRDDAISRIRSIEPALRALGAQALYLFGSTARNEANAASDVDVFIDRDPATQLGLMDLAHMQRVMSETLGKPVDLGTRTGLHPVLKDEIQQSAIRVF